MPADLTIEQVQALYPDWTFVYEYGYWRATHTGFEASWEGEEDGYVGNGLDTSGRTPADVASEIECIIEEHPHFNKSETGKLSHEPHS